MAASNRGGPRTRSSSNPESPMTDQIQDLFNIELSKYLQSSVFQVTLTNAIRSAINEAVEVATKPLKDKINLLESQLTLIKEKSNDNEQYSRRCNIRITGIEESEHEDCYTKVIAFCDKELGVIIEQQEIDRAHRVGRPKEDASHRSIIVKLKSFKTKLQVMKNKKKLKGKNVYVNEDLTKSNQELYMYARRECRSRGDLAYTRDGVIFVKRRADERLFRIRRSEDLMRM